MELTDSFLLALFIEHLPGRRCSRRCSGITQSHAAWSSGKGHLHKHSLSACGNHHTPIPTRSVSLGRPLLVGFPEEVTSELSFAG